MARHRLAAHRGAAAGPRRGAGPGRGRVLIRLIQRHLQAIYDLEAPDVRDFLVDAEAVADHVDRPAREWVLVRQDGEDVDIGVYLQPEDVARIDPLTPADAVRTALAEFCTVTEGVSHFLLLVHRASKDEPLSLLELEAQAEVDKYVTAALHLHADRGGVAGGSAPRPKPGSGSAEELRRRLFRSASLADGLTAAERERYLEAGRLAERYCAHLERLGSVDRWLGELRRFYRMSGPARLDRLRRAA